MRALPLLVVIALPAFAQQPADAPVAAAAPAPNRMQALLDADAMTFNVEGLPRTELQRLKFTLQEARPGIGAPIGMIGGGAVAGFFGLGMTLAASIGYSGKFGIWTTYNQADPLGGAAGPSPSGTAIAAWTFGTILIVASAALITFGSILLKNNSAARRLAGFKLDLIEAELARQSTPPAAPANPDYPPAGEPETR